MAAAITAARNGAAVTVLEKKEQVGKKLSVTGNGRCNFSNRTMSADFYHGNDASFAARVISRFTVKDAVDFMHSVGILETEKNGGLYPVNLQAQAVTGALYAEMKRLNITVVTGADVTGVKRNEKGFTVRTTAKDYSADAVILALGTEAGVRDKNPYTAVKILKALGHHVYPQKPVLTQLYGKNGTEDWWNGVRMTGAVSYNGVTECGELQLTREGISGIPVFQISHSVSEALRSEKEAVVCLDLIPEYTEEELREFFKMRAAAAGKDGVTAEEILQGVLPRKMIPVASKKAGFKRDARIYEQLDSGAENLIKTIKSFPYTVCGTGDMSMAQAASGGVDTREIKDTMESVKIPGLYVTGELLDIDGACGGYNLHFAWSTGVLAGEDASCAGGTK